MAKFNYETADLYSNTSQTSFFSLKDDKDVAQVRFLYNDIKDIEGYACHEIEVDGKRRIVSCLREHNQPVEDCPLCAAGYHLIGKIYLKLFDIQTNETKFWERGKSIFSRLTSLCRRHNPLVNTIFEIERNGKRGDMKTTYEIIPVETDDIQIEDLPECAEPLGTIILDKSFGEIENFLDTGKFEEAQEERNSRRERKPAEDSARNHRQESRRVSRRIPTDDGMPF